MSSPEWLLVAGIVAFYLQDAAMLLHYDEFVVAATGRRWRAGAGGTEWGGRFLWLPNPLAPHAALFRGAWPLPPAAGVTGRAARLDRYLAALAPFRAGTTCLAILLLAVVPFLLWRHAHPLALLGTMAAVYGLAGALAALLWRRRRALGLGSRAAAWLAVECVACPPHAINLVRKLTLRHGPADAAALAAARLDGPGRDRLARVMSRRVAAFGAPG